MTQNKYKYQLYQDVAYSKKTGMPKVKLFYGRIIRGKLKGKRFMDRSDSKRFVAHKWQLPKRKR